MAQQVGKRGPANQVSVALWGQVFCFSRTVGDFAALAQVNRSSHEASISFLKVQVKYLPKTYRNLNLTPVETFKVFAADAGWLRHFSQVPIQLKDRTFVAIAKAIEIEMELFDHQLTSYWRDHQSAVAGAGCGCLAISCIGYFGVGPGVAALSGSSYMGKVVSLLCCTGSILAGAGCMIHADVQTGSIKKRIQRIIASQAP
jgi:hypothetical protein